MNKKGLFIAIEGIDGAGKTTVAKAVVDSLEKKYSYPVLLTSEPTKKKIGLLLRQYLKNPHAKREVDALLFAADRVEHYFEEIEPFVNNGGIVISDRYVYSSYAYQSSQGLPLEWLIEINKFAPPADLVFLLDVPIDIALERIKKEKRQYSEKFESSQMLMKVQRVYNSMKENPNVKVLDANQPVEKIVKQILDIILSTVNLE